MIENLSNIAKYKDEYFDEEILPERLYYFKIRNGQNLGQKKGYEIIDELKRLKLPKVQIDGKEKKGYSWVTVFNSGLIGDVGRNIQVVAVISGIPIKVFEGTNTLPYESVENTLNDSPIIQNNNLPVPIVQNNVTPNQLRGLADIIQTQNNSAVQVLQDEIARNSEMLREYQRDASIIDQRIGEIIAESNKKYEELMTKYLTSQAELEKEKRQRELEKIQFDLQKQQIEERIKLEKKIDKLEQENNKTDWATTLKDIIPTLQSVAMPFFTRGMPAVAPTTMADYNFEEDEDESK